MISRNLLFFVYKWFSLVNSTDDILLIIVIYKSRRTLEYIVYLPKINTRTLESESSYVGNTTILKYYFYY